MLESRTLRRFARLSPGVRRDLLRVLTSPPNVRADVIRQFYERPSGRAMAEVFMDLEADGLLRLRVIHLLRDLAEDHSQ